MNTSILEELGLSKGEVKVYLSLLSIGECKVGALIEKSSMASSAVHNSLNSLIEKGLVSYVKKGKIKYYEAISPKQLVSFLDDKKQRLINILPELESKQRTSKEKQEAEIFEGTKGIMALLNLLIEDTKKNDEYIFFTVNVNEKNKEIQDFFQMYDSKRKAKGLIVKGLAPKELKGLFKDRKHLKMKFTDYPIPSNISVHNNKVAIFSWEEKPVGYLIVSEQISKMFREFFNKIWH
ncbi:MAG: helix-turn-helix domain-containing protein [archaeon]